MYTLKSIARRGTSLAAAFAIVAASVLSATPAFADTLNPLTKRSLTLSSSSPGWSYTDGSGNNKYAPPNSGANGKQTGNTFGFNTSSDSSSNLIKTMSFQYCTTSAGNCVAPGNDTGAPGSRLDDVANQKSDLNVVTSSPLEVSAADFPTVVSDASASTNPDGVVTAVPGASDPDNPSDATGQFAAKNVAGNFVVYYNLGGTWTYSDGWTMTTKSVETTPVTGKNNYIILTNSTGVNTPADTTFKVVFFGTNDNYITNPGEGAFFVKINTYNVAYDGTTVTENNLEPASDANVIDGGVTVANVMNQSIQITTKVLETMQFSVGTVDPNTLSSDRGTDPMSPLEAAQYATGDAPATALKHTPCDPILTRKLYSDPQNILQLGDQAAESSLSDQHTYSTHSYWRLSSNSSAGATVYYSGHTLSNTEGDQIRPVNGGNGIAAAPQHGAEQFGLALDNGNGSDVNTTVTPAVGYLVNYAQEATYENGVDNGFGAQIDPTVATDVAGNASYHTPQLYPLEPTGDSGTGANYYGGGSGSIDSSPSTTFAFNSQSDTVPAPIASESSQVVDCVTGKMRYMANIAATTPAGIYTTKINYIAAPQY